MSEAMIIKEFRMGPNKVGFGVAIGTLALLVSPCRALDPARAITQYTHDAWRTEEGLPQNSVQAIAQTRDGYLWLGTQEGLVRFDGVRFTVFDSRNSPAIRDDWVRALCEARDGTLWVGTAEGLLRSRNGRFDGWQPDGVLSRAMILQVYQARDGALWVASIRGLVRLKDRVQRLFGEKDGLAVGPVMAV